jgi:hypothetical protein
MHGNCAILLLLLVVVLVQVLLQLLFMLLPSNIALLSSHQRRC